MEESNIPPASVVVIVVVVNVSVAIDLIVIDSSRISYRDVSKSVRLGLSSPSYD
jgi:hypothetical protein